MRKIRLLILTGFTIALSIFVSGGIAKPGSPAGTKGQYELIFAGGYFGEGKATVAASNKIAVMMGDVTEVATGATGKFKANNLALDDGHFTGTGTVLGHPVTLSGRVEAADGKYVLYTRIFCSFTDTATGAGGRVVGKQ